MFKLTMEEHLGQNLIKAKFSRVPTKRGGGVRIIGGVGNGSI